MEEIFSNLKTKKYHKGHIFLFEGDQVEQIYFLLNGYVKVYNILPDGNKRTIIIYIPQEVFPLVSYLSSEVVVQYFYECLTDVEVKEITQIEFQKSVKGDIEKGEVILDYTHKISQQFVQRIETLTAQSSRHKVILLLDYLANKSGARKNGKISLRMPLTSQEIADLCGLTRETTTMQLIRLRKENVITGGRKISVDIDKLKNLVKS